MADLAAQPAKFDMGQAAFGLGDTAIKGIFAYKTAKVTTSNLGKAPAANTAIIVGGVVALAVVGLLIFR